MIWKLSSLYISAKIIFHWENIFGTMLTQLKLLLNGHRTDQFADINPTYANDEVASAT